ncbi:hypothetical protein FOXB_17423, partial [Fusarium oxysporum f. sp. conglutinans Fo5176]
NNVNHKYIPQYPPDMFLHYVPSCRIYHSAEPPVAPNPRSRRPSLTTTPRRFGHYLHINIHLIN